MTSLGDHISLFTVQATDSFLRRVKCERQINNLCSAMSTVNHNLEEVKSSTLE